MKQHTKNGSLSTGDKLINASTNEKSQLKKYSFQSSNETNELNEIIKHEIMEENLNINSNDILIKNYRRNIKP